MRLARTTRRLLPIALVLLAAASIPAPSMAAKPHAGSVDRSFGRNGRVVFNLPGERMQPRAVAVDDSGRILVAGGAPLVVRFLPNGRLDPAFGAGGIARVALPKPVTVEGLALQPDGKLVLSGAAPGEPGQALGAVVRLLPTGAVDAGFGSEGLATVPGENPGITPTLHELPHIAVQADGRIVAAGSQRASDVHVPADPFVVRLLPDGVPDPSFDGNGTARAGTSNPAAVLPYPDGHTLIAGSDEEYFGTTFLTAMSLGAGTNDFPCCANHPQSVLRSYHYRHTVTAVAATSQAAGGAAIAGELHGGSRGRTFLAWVRIGSGLEPLDRGKAPSIDGVDVATFDSRGAVITGGIQVQGGPFSLQRYRGPRFHPDRSFGARDGRTSFDVRDTTTPIGLAMQGDDKLIAVYTDSTPSGDQRVKLIRVHARQDISGPRLTIRGLPRDGCLAEATPLSIRIRDESRTRTRLLIDGHPRRTTRHKNIQLMLHPEELVAGKHQLGIDSHDAAGNLARRSVSFRSCAG